MSEHTTISILDAARRLGVSIRILRQAIRAGRVPAPPQLGATASMPAAWLASVEATLLSSPKAFSLVHPPKVPAFARYEGTSAWRKYPNRVREYARFRAA